MKTQYINPLGYGWMAWGAFQIAIGGAFALVYILLGGLLGAVGQEEEMVMGVFFGVAGIAVGLLLLVFGGLDIAVGWGLTKRARWSRIGAFVVSLLNISSFPFGMILAIGSVVVLLDEDVAKEFRGEA